MRYAGAKLPLFASSETMEWDATKNRKYLGTSFSGRPRDALFVSLISVCSLTSRATILSAVC